MSTTLLKIILTFLSTAAVASGFYLSQYCPDNQFRCIGSGDCIGKGSFCDGSNNCNDNSDEKYCDNFRTKFNGGCPLSWWKCNDGRCIPNYWKCNSYVDCVDDSDEEDCAYLEEPTDAPVLEVADTDGIAPGSQKAKKNLTTWFLRRRKEGTTTNRWGHQLHRTATALFFADKKFFAPGNRTGEELSYELDLQLLSKLDSKRKLNSNELATDIHALLVACIEPKNFHGHNLVSELRSKMDGSNPFEILILCNAGDAMTSQDAQNAANAFHSKHRPFTIDNQAMALQALACIRSRTHFTLNGTDMEAMEQELKRRQFENGTVGTLRTTALVLQALIATRSYEENFNFDSAMKAILEGQKHDGSFGSLLDSYYIMPLLSKASLLNITTSHCQQPTKTETDALSEYRNMRGKRVQVRYSIRFGEEEDLRKAWTLYVPLGSSFYDVIEIVNKLDSRQKVQYNVESGEPYVSSLNEVQDDLETGLYWFTFVGHTNSGEEPNMIMKSPVEVKIKEHDELILWYRQAQKLTNSTAAES